MKDDYLNSLYLCANAACRAAIEEKETLGGAVNYADLSCAEALRSINNFGVISWRVVIEEADPASHKLSTFISKYLMDHGFPDVEVSLEW